MASSSLLGVHSILHSPYICRTSAGEIDTTGAASCAPAPRAITLTDRSSSQTRRAEMQRTLAVTGLAAGLAGASVLACSSSADPATAPSTPPLVAAAALPTLTPQRSGTTNRLQAVDPVSRNVVWASGLGGTFVVTTDGGQHWRKGVVAGASKLEFRDIEGVSANVAYLMSSGPGSDSRIYKTTNGGNTWSLQFQNKKENAFYDCFDFWTPQ